MRTHRTQKHSPQRAKSRRGLFYAVAIAALATSLAAAGIAANLESPRSLMTRQDYSEARKALEARTRSAFAGCRALEGAPREVCKVQVRADDRVRKAELDARYYGTVTAESQVALVRAKAQYDVARARCNERIGEDRAACLKSARSDKARSLAEARPSST